MIPIGLRAAIRLMTVVPLRWNVREATVEPARTIVWFPIVGLGIGCLLYPIMGSPLPQLPRATLCLIVWIAITGGLHEDGLMDCADAALAAVDADARTAIRKDPHVGAHAVTVAGLLLLSRFAALAAVSAPAVVLAPVVGRWSMAVTLSVFPPHLSSELGAAYGARARAYSATAIGGLITATLCIWQHELRLALAAAAGLSGGVLSARWVVRRLGGASGDVHGAAAVIAETVTLYALL